MVGSRYKYIEEKEKRKIDNFLKILDVEKKYRKKKDDYYNEYNKKKLEKDKKENELNQLIKEKNDFVNQKSYYNNDKERINENIKKIDRSIILGILDLIKISHKIKIIAMNPNHEEIELKYINENIQRMEEMGSDKNKLKKLKEFQKYKELFNELKNINEEDLIRNGSQFFMEKLSLFKNN